MAVQRGAELPNTQLRLREHFATSIRSGYIFIFNCCTNGAFALLLVGNSHLTDFLIKINQTISPSLYYNRRHAA